MSDDGSGDRKIKLFVIGIVAIAIAALVVVGGVQSMRATPPAPPPAVVQAPTAVPSEAEPAAQVTSIAVDTTVDVVRSGDALPFAIASGGNAEVAGGVLVSGRLEMTLPAPGGVMVQRLPDAGSDTWVLLPIQPNHKRSILGKSVAMAQRTLIPMLSVDGTGLVHPLGFAYEDSQRRIAMLEPELGLRALSQTPELLPNRSDQRMWLIFRVPKGASLTGLYLGRRKVAEWQPPLSIK